MGSERKNISVSLRWTIFARDGFTCRYCGAQAGQEGVELAVDHVISVADGGDDSVDNLVTACRKCNGGKGARSLRSAPTPAEVVARIEARARSLNDQSDAIRAATSAHDEAARQAIILKCTAYGVNSAQFIDGEVQRIIILCRQHGADSVLEWYNFAAAHAIPQARALKYVHGIIRNIREASCA